MAGEDKCYICKSALWGLNEGDPLTPFQLPGYSDHETLRVCVVCEQKREHKSLVEQTEINHRAEASYQEWCAENDKD